MVILTVLATLIVWVVLRLVRWSRLSTSTRTQLVVAALARDLKTLWSAVRLMSPMTIVPA